ncbi:MAG TPA: prepilin-type N-terminal cleavage/methylation domain-containing protein [Planctomycetota bacterium]|nr:prepilin-type N-terminal cleavage/methylation domain-containing protein [Planctomycetota bacterium]
MPEMQTAPKPANQRSRGRGRRGMTMAEVMIAVAIMTLCVSLLSRTISSTAVHTAAKREKAIAVEVAKNVLEDMHNVEFAEIFARYNADPSDDPEGSGTAPGPGIDVPMLTPQAGDADGFVGEVILPAEGAILLENVVVAELGLPRDLNGDALIDGEDHAQDYIVLPVSVRLQWTGRGGARTFELTTMFADLSKL